MRAARSSHQSYCEEVRTIVVHPARTDVLSFRLHDLHTVCAGASQRSIRVGLRAKGSLICRRRMGPRRTARSRLVAATIKMDDFIWAHRHSDCCDLFWRRTSSSSGICARRSFGRDDAIMGSIPQHMGLPRGSDPTGRWNRLGPEQSVSDSRSLDRRIDDRSHSLPLYGCTYPRPRRINAGDQ